MDRRTFLVVSGAPVLAPALAALGAAAQAPAQRFRIGHNVGPYLRLGGPPHEGFWQGVEELAALGFPATEADDNLARLSTVYASQTNQFRDRLASHGMQMAALYHNLPVDDAARFAEGVAEGMAVGKFMHETGIAIFNLSGGTRKPGGNPPEDFAALARLVNELGKRLREEYGIQLGYHPHTNNMIENRAEIGRMMDMTDPRSFNLNPDTGHLVAGGSDPLEVFRTYRSRIHYLHLKDWDPTMVTARTAQTGRTGGFPELGEGIVPLPQLVEFLRQTGYDKWVMIEIDSSRTTPRDSATKDLKYVTDRLKLRVG